MSNEMVPYADMERMAKDLVNSRFFGVKNIDECMALMLIAQAEGLHPAVAVRDYDVIQGKPALKARAMLSRFQISGGKVDWKIRTDTECEAVFSHPQSPTPVKIRWDIARATKAKLVNKDNWQKHPGQMLAARVTSEGVNACYPAACNGCYTPEEVEDFDPPTKKADVTVKEAPKTTPQTVQNAPQSATMANGSVVRSLDPPTDVEAAAKDAAINGTPLPIETKPTPPAEMPTPEFEKTMIICGKEGRDWIRKFAKDMTPDELQFAYDHTMRTKGTAKGKVLENIEKVQGFIMEVAAAQDLQVSPFALGK